MSQAGLLDTVKFATIRDLRLGFRTIDVKAKRMAGDPAIVVDPGSSDPQHLNLVGEIKIGFVKQKKVELPEEGRISLGFEPPAWLSKQLYTEPGLMRFVFDYYPEQLHQNRRQLAELADDGEQLAVDLTRFDRLTPERRAKVQARLKSMGLDLLRKVDPLARDAGKHYALASGLVDALRRVNLYGNAAKVTASNRRVKVAAEKLRLDEASLLKLQGNLRQMQQLRQSAMRGGWRVLEQPVSPKLAQTAKDWFGDLIWKPYSFPTNLAFHWLSEQPLADDVFSRIRRAYFSELVFEEFDALLAEITNDPAAGFRRHQLAFSSLLGDVHRLGVEPYRQLARQVGRHERMLGTVFLVSSEVRQAQAMRGHIETMRSLIRYRFDPERPETKVWLPTKIAAKYVG